MNTDLHDPRQTSPDDGPQKHEPAKSPLSIIQVVAGALAAMTAAALGSRLSVAGTVVGAALASVIAALAGAAYTASLRRTSKHVSAVLTRVRPPAPGARPSRDEGRNLPAPSSAAGYGTDWELPAGPGSRASGTEALRSRPRVGWKPVLVAALLMFAVAAVALTGVELATGHALSGGSGTTAGRVAAGGTEPSSEPSSRSTPRPSATPSATVTPTAEPTAEPTPTESSTSSDEPSTESTGTPTAAPSATLTPTPSSTPPSAA